MTTAQLEKEIKAIHQEIINNNEIRNSLADKVHPQYRQSAKNLYNYLVMRSFDLRKLHDHLSDLGISSMRTAEGYVSCKLTNVIKLLRLLQGKNSTNKGSKAEINYKKSKVLLQKHANDLFNNTRNKHFTEIMVTMPEAAADNITLIRDLVAEGMEVARINLAHGNMDMWKKIVNNIKRVKKETGSKIKIYMDLAGPKIRIASIERKTRKGKLRNYLKIKRGEHLILTKRKTKGKQAEYGTNNIIYPAEAGVLPAMIVDNLKTGDAVYFDDGMIEAIVISKKADEAELVITKAYKTKLTARKGINLPETHLDLPPLTKRDLKLLPFVCKYADILGYSFVRDSGDVKRLYEELEKLGNNEIGVVFKIETQEAFTNLPLILFEAMRRNKIGVMIARGDLAVEIGFERISEVQNQILWLCEAAHIPVVWATQVLDNLAKTGIATRSEISDAAMSTHAECVMLNKGPHIVEAVRTLKEILIKMEKHSFKKKSALRALNVAKKAIKEIEIYTPATTLL